jgi:hypothetical protein
MPKKGNNMAKIDHAKLNKQRNTETYVKQPKETKLLSGTVITCSITTTDSGSIKCQVKGDATPKQALALMAAALKKNGNEMLYWPSLYFGTKKKEWNKSPTPFSKVKYPTESEVINQKVDSVISDEDLPWIL